MKRIISNTVVKIQPGTHRTTQSQAYFVFPERYNPAVVPDKVWSDLSANKEDNIHFPSEKEAIEWVQENIADTYNVDVKLVNESNEQIGTLFPQSSLKAVDSATFTKYNANNRGNNTGDCVKRGLSIAFDMDYNQVSKELLQIMKSKGADSWKITRVFEQFILNHGGKRGETCWEDHIQVDDWIDQHPEGTYILLTGNKPDTLISTHLTCAIDGRLIDSWNSLGQYVKEYYVVEGRSPFEVSDIQDHFDELGEMGRELVLELMIKYAEKYNLREVITWSIGQPKHDAFSIKIPVSIQINKFDKPSYYFKVAYVFSPKTTRAEAEKKIKEISKIRMYDRFYAINAELVGKQEGADLYEKSQEKNTSKLYFWDYETQRAYNSLPHWCKPFVTNLWVQNPGQYSDSYQMKMIALPGDPNRDRVQFWASSADELKAELAWYKQDYRRPGIDYDPYEEF